ncbi:Nuclear pore complex protein Nup88 [Clonorchis sinensis]|uniref:Nuclear pore complex protein Nup88 n=1 Tax=Clonorchis sinensis TaxID=79923 RepID=A0A8T1M7L2_CLOSI|nr:Nuclear pore complex protein Nup88 [Clonorchis sinensis]
MKEALIRTLKDIELADFSVYDSCMQRKVVHHHIPSGTIRLFVLNEKLGEVNVLTRTKDSSEFTRTVHLLTPMPTLRICAMLLSPTGSLLMLNTHTTVYVLDVASNSKKTTERSVTKRMYTAFDTTDFPELERTHSQVLRVRWHPRCKDILVLLTSNSSIFYVQCCRLDGSREIRCTTLFQTGNLGILHNRAVDVTYDGSSQSSDEFSEGDEASFTSYGRSRLDLDGALGDTCIDFDFGAVLPKRTTKSRQSGAEENDCCLYILCETGDVILVSGCLSTLQRSHLDCQLLRILPHSSDNYGEEFCSLLCLSSWTKSISISVANSMELPPDVLVLANRDGRLFHGIVLHSAGQLSKRSEPSEGPALCLVDVVDLHLHEAATSEVKRLADAVLDESLSPNGDISAQLPALVLEPAQSIGLPLNLDGCSDSLTPDLSYPYGAYYVIHDSGIHLVRLPWLRSLCGWCQELLEDPLATKKENSTNGRAGDWHSEVTHLLCAQLPISSRDRTFLQESDGRFRLLALIELPLANRFGLPLMSATGSHNSPTLLIVRAPQPTMESYQSDPSILIDLIRLDSAEPTLKANWKRRSLDEDNVSAEHERTNFPGPSSRSEFALQLRRILRQEDLHLPLISALSLQSNLTQVQVIQFLVKTTNTLRSGSLDRLIRARNFVEQYTARLQDCLSIQYTEACQLAAERQVLQDNAKKLANRHAIILERQEMLEKRLGALACRLTGLIDEPSKAEVAMRDEVVQLRNRLQKGLKTWFASLQSKRSDITDKLTRLDRIRALGVSGQDPSMEHEPDKAQMKSISELLKKQTHEIRTLVDTLKMISCKTSIAF